MRVREGLGCVVDQYNITRSVMMEKIMMWGLPLIYVVLGEGQSSSTTIRQVPPTLHKIGA